MRMKLRALALAAVVCALALPAHAQQVLMVPSCNAAALPANTGYGPMTMTPNGVLCTSAGSGGTSSTFGAAFPATGTAVGGSDGTTFQPLAVDPTTHYLQVDIKAGAGSGGTALADAGAFVAGTTNFTPSGGFFQTTATSNPLTNGQGGWAQMTASRSLFINLRNSSGAELLGQTTMTGSVPVTIASNQGTVNVQTVGGSTMSVSGGGASNATSGVATSSTMVPTVASLYGFNGTTWDQLQVDASKNLKTTALGTGAAGTAATGVMTVQGIAGMTKLLVTPDSVALPANQSVNMAQIGGTNTVSGGVAGTQGVGGTAATNVAITANPINTGAQAVSSENTAVTTARQVQLVADLVGKLIVLPYANPENFVSGVITSAMTGTTSTSLVAAPAAGLRNYITQCVFSNSHATVGTDILIQDGSGGTTLYLAPAAPAFGGATITFPTPLRQPTTATAIFVANVTTGANTKAACSGYKGA